MRVYELVYIVKPDIPEEEVDTTLTLVRETLEGGGATIDKEEKWGKRRLAYRVQKFEDGYYVLVQYSLADDKEKAGVPKEVERRLRVADAVIKFMTVRIDEDLKRVEKAKKKREGRSSRKPSGGPGRPSSGGDGGGSSSESNTPGQPSNGSKDDDNES
ncbi:MAG: 30S ribosomal protein S6 [Bryobacterales bacterium]